MYNLYNIYNKYLLKIFPVLFKSTEVSSACCNSNFSHSARVNFGTKRLHRFRTPRFESNSHTALWFTFTVLANLTIFSD